MTKIMCRTVYYGDREFQPKDVLPHVASQASNLASGELEGLRAEVTALAELLGSVSARLPVEELVDIANAHHYETFRLEPSE